MATNIFFRNYDNFNEQNLIDDLVIESIQIHGLDMVYITRTLQAVDQILNEDDLSIFTAAYSAEMYIKSVDGFQGEGDFLSKFGLQIQDQATFTIARRTFERYITRQNPLISRPLEGDLIYLPLNNKLFKVAFVEHESVFYQTGALQVYDMKCELFEFSGERFETGDSTIDSLYDSIRTDTITTLTGLNDSDPIAKNIFFEEEADDIIDFTEIDPFSEIIRRPLTNNAVTADSIVITTDSTSITADIN
jgi:hypothetical protein